MNQFQNYSKRGMWLRALLLAAFVTGCGSSTSPIDVSPTTPGGGSGTGAGAGPAPVDMGTAGNYVILAKTAISNTGTSAITGNLGLSPSAASAITGFALNLTAGAAFST